MDNEDYVDDDWTAEMFHHWLMEEAFQFRKKNDGILLEESEKTRPSAEWGVLFREWLENII